MSSRLPTLRAGDIIRVLKFLGFSEARTRGSHVFFRHSDGRTTVVPKHGNEDIGRGLLRQIIREIKVTPEEFLKLL